MDNKEHDVISDRRQIVRDNDVTLDQIKEWGIAGNAYADWPVIDGCHKILVADYATLEDKLSTLNYLSNDVMGLDEPLATEEDLKSYIADCELMEDER
jgi:hypothetical protein